CAKLASKKESLKTALLYFIAECYLPLSLVESPAFHTLLELCNSSISNILLPWAALTSHLSKMYLFHQEHLSNILSDNNTFLSFTNDTWTSPNMRAFMAVTAHFLNKDFNLQSVILGLIELNGASLAQHFMEILRRYNLEDLIISITSDNASVNTQMANIIQTMTPAFSADTQAVGCMAHTLHLAAQDGLNTLAQPLPSSGFHQNDELDLPGPMSIASIVDQPDGMDLHYGSIISRITQLGSYLRQTPQRHEQFVTTVKLFHDDIKSNMLLTNVCTRWNSTYIMLERALSLKEAYNQFCAPANMEQYRLTFLEWDKVRFMINFLQPLDEATGITCGSKYPTINYALPLYISLIRHIHQACGNYDVQQIEPAAVVMTTKLNKYLQILLCKKPVIYASTLDPWIKMNFFEKHDLTLAWFGTSASQLSTIFEEETKRHFNGSMNPLPQNTEKEATGLFDEMYPPHTTGGKYIRR
ncbi:hypothetical protein O181_120157, partial [Austropuccinia psidii MF-1]|nr:hypothetical protein [Austropuccinia psidii MF-1]